MYVSAWHWYRTKFGASGTSIRGKIWQAGTDEPGSWSVTATDSSYSGGDYFGLMGGWRSRTQIDYEYVALVKCAFPEPTAAIGAESNYSSEGTLESVAYSGFQSNGVPVGLEYCHICGDWKGLCLDPSPDFKGKMMRVFCKCQNFNRCAFCGEPLYDRRLNANYYNPEDGRIWHVPGFTAFNHKCNERSEDNE